MVYVYSTLLGQAIADPLKDVAPELLFDPSKGIYLIVHLADRTLCPDNCTDHIRLFSSPFYVFLSFSSLGTLSASYTFDSSVSLPPANEVVGK